MEGFDRKAQPAQLLLAAMASGAGFLD